VSTLEADRLQFGLTMLVWGLGLTLITLFLLTLVVRALNALFRPR
jgi:Na+-transporting methylmalonyl-CoA/oxaloacetate decarboxylase gamma subunit